jgi:hypothetical protein
MMSNRADCVPTRDLAISVKVSFAVRARCVPDRAVGSGIPGVVAVIGKHALDWTAVQKPAVRSLPRTISLIRLAGMLNALAS